MKKRVKCANCGTIYDIYVPDGIFDSGQVSGTCPKCLSNACDEISTQQWKRYK